MSRSRRWKKQFDCGHRGFGRVCQVCRPAIVAASLRKEIQRQEQEEWNALFELDSIDLRKFPKAVVLRTRTIVAALLGGEDYRLFLGKRFGFDRSVIRIPVTYRYRLVCHEVDGVWTPTELLSHEDYNPRVRRKSRV